MNRVILGLKHQTVVNLKISARMKSFVTEYRFVTVTSGFMVAHAGSAFIDAVISGFIMQLIQPLVGNVQWDSHELVIGPFSFLWGNIVASALHLSIVILVLVAVIKYFESEEVRD